MINESYISPSAQLRFEVVSDFNIVVIEQQDMKRAGIAEYLHFIGLVGDVLKFKQTGKILFDIRKMTNYDLMSRAAAIKELNTLLFAKAPYFLLAVVKGNSLFENMATQAAISAARPISKKFLGGKMFDSREEAVIWLNEFSIPPEFKE
ncbi:MAG: hypothetical protein EBR30_05245 [Cytophagia bacterium]|nr:hypothetical protein [Cytophagia bacterium]NBW34418.1 hypothetical protein [Cytophagia bacterium]